MKNIQSLKKNKHQLLLTYMLNGICDQPFHNKSSISKFAYGSLWLLSEQDKLNSNSNWLELFS